MLENSKGLNTPFYLLIRQSQFQVWYNEQSAGNQIIKNLIRVGSSETTREIIF
jgi:hypothetical protein